MVMAALRARDAGGGGRHLDVSQLSGTISLLGVEWMRYRATGIQPPPSANRSPNHCPHGVFPARGEDEWCAIAVESDAEWRSLCGLLEHEELSRDARFATHAARKAHEDEVDEIVSAFTRGRERFELAEALQAVGVAAAPVESLRDTCERDPQLRDHYQRIRQPSAPGVAIPIDGEAIRFVGLPHRLRRAPMLGEHSERVLREIVGLGGDELDALVVAGVVG
jgi:crotonobetainyl-CoA:carnitine CoA-transferase CaiB-like acyl-CoA transferase